MRHGTCTRWAPPAPEATVSCGVQFPPRRLPARRASDKCQREKRKTINGDDLLWAMSTLGFEEYVEPLKIFLAKFREVRGRGVGAARVFFFLSVVVVRVLRCTGWTGHGVCAC